MCARGPVARPRLFPPRIMAALPRTTSGLSDATDEWLARHPIIDDRGDTADGVVSVRVPLRPGGGAPKEEGGILASIMAHVAPAPPVGLAVIIPVTCVCTL